MPILGQRCPAARSYTTREKARALFKAHPFSMSLASFMILFGLGGLVWTGYYYKNYIIGGFSRYPEPVAKKLRRALYYSNIRPSPTEAVQHYWDALKVASEVGMDPLSDEVLGIQIQLAAFLEQIQQYKKAIDVLEHVLRQCRGWVDQHRELERTSRLPESDEDYTSTRQRLLLKAVSTAVKLAELYDNELGDNKRAVEDRLTWAVETVLKEEQKRQQQLQADEQRGFVSDDAVREKEDAGVWLTSEQIGATFEALAHHYEERAMYHLALPLFLKALSMNAATDERAALLMNNIAACFAQQSTLPRAPDDTSTASREQLLRSARAWVDKASQLTGRGANNTNTNTNTNYTLGNESPQSPTTQTNQPTGSTEADTDPNGDVEKTLETTLAVLYNDARISELEGALDRAIELYHKTAGEASRHLAFRALYTKAWDDYNRLKRSRSDR